MTCQGDLPGAEAADSRIGTSSDVRPASPVPVLVERTVELPLDRDATWALVSTAEGLARWLGRDVDFGDAEGAPLQVDDDGTIRQGRLTELEAGRRLAFEWAPADRSAPASTVTIEVEELTDSACDSARRTRVRVTERTAGGTQPLSLSASSVVWDQRLLHLGLASLLDVPAFAAGPAGVELI